jgi:hypothetical protein
MVAGLVVPQIIKQIWDETGKLLGESRLGKTKGTGAITPGSL